MLYMITNDYIFIFNYQSFFFKKNATNKHPCNLSYYRFVLDFFLLIVIVQFTAIYLFVYKTNAYYIFSHCTGTVSWLTQQIALRVDGQF